FEFEDFPWFPGVLREGQTDYLHFVISNAGIYKPAAAIMKDVLDNSDTNEIIDLCSGGGGGIDLFQKNIEEITGRKIKITISDKYPNIPAFEKIRKMTSESIDYIKEPVDIKKVPENIKSIRTIFSAFHHFNPDDAGDILKDAVKNKVSIGIFEGGNKNILYFLGILLTTPVIFFFITPFLKPFKLSRLFFTYIIPLIPITTTWDGLVSILRMYTPNEMLKMAKEAGGDDYIWKAGKAKGRLGNTIMYLTGYPK
ncbi:MAG: class I SAM-dependent methyltransferase, partial [Ignavibacteria bacterium]